jgi:sulfopyruvate decarboxylase TPP-binding subunit
MGLCAGAMGRQTPRIISAEHGHCVTINTLATLTHYRMPLSLISYRGELREPVASGKMAVHTKALLNS